EDDSLLEFLAEGDENLDGFEEALLGLERAPEDRELITAAFRHVHSIKGTAGFFGFERVGALTHAGESVLARMRDGELTLTPAIAGQLFAMSDATRQMLASIRASGHEGKKDVIALIAGLVASAARAAAAPAAAAPEAQMWPAPAASAPAALPAPLAEEPEE